MFRRKRKHSEVVANIERLQRENDALQAQIDREEYGEVLDALESLTVTAKKRDDWKEGGPAVLLPSREQMLSLTAIRRSHDLQRSMLGARSLSAGYPHPPRRPEDLEISPKVQWIVDDPRSITVLPE